MIARVLTTMKICPIAKILAKVGSKLLQMENNLEKIAERPLSAFAKVAKFRRIWSHRYERSNLFNTQSDEISSNLVTPIREAQFIY